MTRTLQTRRYRLRPDAAEDFVSWWSSTLVELRENAGFQVEFASYSPDTYEFLWGVSAPGDEDDFLALEAKYVKSPPAQAAFSKLPDRVESRDLRFGRLITGQQHSYFVGVADPEDKA